MMEEPRKAEEVNSPQQEEPSITRVTTEKKNPKKVAAGRAGAAARKAKHERALEEMRYRKGELCSRDAEIEEPRDVVKQEPPPPPSQSVYIGVSLAIAAVATVALVYYSKKKSTPPEVPQLKTRRRSLHME